MKKFFLCFMVLLIPITMLGCQRIISLEDSMSEITKLYFSAEGDGVRGNISVGEREENYIIDGTHTENVDFTLISIKFDVFLPENKIEVDLQINGVTSLIVMDLNPANHFYMTDLGYAIEGSDSITIQYQNFILNFENESDNFSVDYKKALKIAKNELGDKIELYYVDKNFIGEGYLKILNEKGDNQPFWVLTLINKEGLKNNIVINVENGEVLVND